MRELLEENKIGNHIQPIIEPVKYTTTFVNTLNNFKEVKDTIATKEEKSMFKHFLLIAPDHRQECRMGWHKLITSSDDYKVIKDVVKKIAVEVEDTQLASHIIVTDSSELKSIKNKDAFFSDVVFFESEDEFINNCTP